MLARARCWWGRRLAAIRAHSDRGAIETVDIVMWVGVTLAVVVLVGGFFRDDIVSFWNSLTFEVGLSDAP